MEFEWDDKKNASNMRKHGFDFTDAAEIFSGPMLIIPDEREDYGEDRWLGIGMLQSRQVVILYTQRGEDAIRVISPRKAHAHERKQFEAFLRDRLGAN
jgi:uncharacterized DUF497 family protein